MGLSTRVIISAMILRRREQTVGQSMGMHSVRSSSRRAPESETLGHRTGSFEGRATLRDSTPPRWSWTYVTAAPSRKLQRDRNIKCGKLRPKSLYKPEGFTSLVHPTHHDETPGTLPAQRRHPYLSAGGSDVQNPSPSTHFVTGTKGNTPAIHIDSRPAMSSTAARPAVNTIVPRGVVDFGSALQHT